MNFRNIASTSEWSELSRELDRLASSGTWAFRGQSRDYATMYSAIDRITTSQGASFSLRQLLALEREITVDFFRYGAGAAAGLDAASFSSWLNMQALLRHYGGPTRLLDWSLDWRVAAFWAFESDPTEPSFVYAFNMHALQPQHTHIKDGGSHTCFMTHGYKEGVPMPLLLDYKTVSRDTDEPAVIALDPPIKFPRMTVQRGIFTIATHPQIDHWSVISSVTDPDYIRIYEFAPKVKNFAIDRITNKMHISHATLLPGIHGAALHANALALKKSYRSKWAEVD